MVEGLQLYTFYGAGAQARFDQFSHILPSYQIGDVRASCTRASRSRSATRISAMTSRPRDSADRATLDYLLGK